MSCGIRLRILLLTAMVLLVMAHAVTADTIIYVDDDATGTNDGTSWPNAYTYLQDALADANASPKPAEIHVAQGIYKPDQGTGITPGDRTTAFQLINGVTIKGGYAGFGEYTPDARDYIRYETILSGDLAGNDVEGLELFELRDHPSRLENSYHVFFHWALNLDQNAALEGFTITGGNARDPGAGGGMYNYFHGSPKVSECTFIHNSASNGGGMFNEISDPTIERCVFIGNRADSAGGGIYNVRANPMIKDCSLTANSAKWSGGAISNSYSNPRIERCQIKDNSAELHYGGGIYNGESSPYLENCFFTGNSAESGGGVYNINRSSPTVKLCSFTANSARYNGGGMFNYGWSAKLEACTFSNNSANRGGGGIYNEHYSRAILDGCSFTSNTTPDYGGGMYNNNNSNPLVQNSTFKGNSATKGGGAVYNINYSSPILKGCTFWANLSYIGGALFNDRYSNSTVEVCTFSNNLATFGGGIYNASDSPSTVANCILWADAPTEISGWGHLPIVTFSDVQGGWSGTGNINADPRFVNRDSNDFHLRPDSPCINAGYPNYVPEPNETDVDGEIRVMLGRVDMGADEFNPFLAQFVVVRKQRVGRTVFEYDFKVVLENISRFAVSNVSLEMAEWSENMTIIDTNVSFDNAEIGPGEPVTSIDTCTFTVDRSESIDPAEIVWHVSAELAGTRAKMQHTVSAALPPEPLTDFDGLKVIAQKWLWQGTAGGIGADTVEDGTVNLADFARFAQTWLKK